MIALVAGCKGNTPPAKAPPPVEAAPVAAANASAGEGGPTKDPWVDVAIPGWGFVVSMPPDVHPDASNRFTAHAPRSGFKHVLTFSKVPATDPITIPALSEALGQGLQCKPTVLDPHLEKKGELTLARFEVHCTDPVVRVLVRIRSDAGHMIMLVAAAPPPGDPNEAEALRFVGSLREGTTPPGAPDSAWEKVVAPNNSFTIDMPRGAVHTKKQTESGMPYYRAQSSLPGLANSFVALEMPWRPTAANETPDAWMNGFVIGLGRRAQCGTPTSWVERDDRSPEHLVLRYEVRCPQDGNIMSGEIHWVGESFHVLIVTLGDNEQKMSVADIARFYSSYEPK